MTPSSLTFFPMPSSHNRLFTFLDGAITVRWCCIQTLLFMPAIFHRPFLVLYDLFWAAGGSLRRSHSMTSSTCTVPVQRSVDYRRPFFFVCLPDGDGGSFADVLNQRQRPAMPVTLFAALLPAISPPARAPTGFCAHNVRTFRALPYLTYVASPSMPFVLLLLAWRAVG